VNEDEGQRRSITRAGSAPFAKQLADATKLTSPSSAFTKQFADLAKLTSPSGSLAKQFADLAKLTSPLATQLADATRVTIPSGSLAKQFADLAKLTSPSAMQLADATKLTSPSSAFTKQFADLAKLTSPSGSLAKQFADLAKLTSPLATQLADATRVSASAALAKQLADLTKLTSPSSVWAKQFRTLTMLSDPTASLTTRYGNQLQKLAKTADIIKNYEERVGKLADVATLHNIRSLTLKELAPVVGAIDGFPHSTVLEQIFADQLVATAANENKLNEVRGASIAIDAAAAEQAIEAEGPAGLSSFLDGLADAIRHHFERVQNLADLSRLYHAAMLIIAAVTLWYAMNSAVKDAVNNLTEAVREEARTSRQHTASKLDEVARSINEHAARRLSMFEPAPVYIVKRAVALKAERRMKSDTVGILQVGQAVFRLQNNKKWIYVEGSDLVTGERVSGWVVKKYLRRL
jgi:hypothetical protein